ncbi:hypothetical protein DNTS_016498 [Danionella cerebrum]|uniref:Uncharacterized protein n=1 Tax=Danionella cerebrum TaxID=2873325 RepID=A0A553RIS1_9TELE|nr:hypothetical protein DNTS_016498 [Danionella translucida]
MNGDAPATPTITRALISLGSTRRAPFTRLDGEKDMFDGGSDAMIAPHARTRDRLSDSAAGLENLVNQPHQLASSVFQTRSTYWHLFGHGGVVLQAWLREGHSGVDSLRVPAQYPPIY